MPQLPPRESLELMKRTDLQRLCKDYGVKANLKSEALIDLLLDAAKPVARNASMRRSLSAKHAIKSGPSRTSSIVIHDTDEESEGEERIEQSNKTPSETHQTELKRKPTDQQLLPITRAKKGKEQTRLGVGRPILAGGAGPRAVTRSLTVSKGRQGKGSVSMKPIEATIVEEVETEGAEQVHDNLPEVSNQSVTPLASIEYLAEIDKRVADALRPLHEQMKSMRQELELMQSLKTEVNELKAQIGDKKGLEEKVEALTIAVKTFSREMEELTPMRDEVNQLKKNFIPSIPSTPKLQHPSLKKRGGPSGVGLPSSLREATQCQELDGSQHGVAPTDAPQSYPGVAPSMLGKRHRDIWTTGVADHASESELTVNDSLSDMQPLAKRARLIEDSHLMTEQSNPLGDQEDGAVQSMEEGNETNSALRFDDLGDFRAPEPAPPTDDLPDFFSPSSPIPEISVQHLTSMTTATQNQQPFTFSFPSMSSTPAHGIYTTSFPYPEPPQSPSPARRNMSPSSRPQPGRSDVFQTFGFPPPGRPRGTGSRNTSGLGSGFINPAALAPSSDHDRTQPFSSVEIETRAGSEGAEKEADISSGRETGTNVVETKRTMYGTELEGDTRFGDFGFEGVGRNGKGSFWSGGRY